MCLEPVECKSKIFTKSKAHLFKKLTYVAFRLETVVIKLGFLICVWNMITNYLTEHISFYLYERYIIKCSWDRNCKICIKWQEFIIILILSFCCWHIIRKATWYVSNFRIFEILHKLYIFKQLSLPCWLSQFCTLKKKSK